MFVLIPGRRNLVVKEWIRCLFVYLVEETLLSREGLEFMFIPGRRNLVVK